MNSKFDLKIKEALHINWAKPNLNAQQNYLALTLSLLLAPLLYFFLSLFFCLSLSSIIFIISDVNYWHLLLSLLHFAITSSHYNTFTFHLLFSFYLTLIIGIFYCLNYASLLLHLIITHHVNTFYNNYAINISRRQLL